MDLTFSSVIEILGIMVFTISGAFSAMQKRLDLFGVLILGFVTATGGGTIRDVLIGNTPVSWMQNTSVPLIILATGILTVLFKRFIKSFKVTLFLFDAIGLGLFTVIGIRQGLDVGLNPWIGVALGTITGCFGGVLRDLLLNQIPILFRKEIYATACIAGGTLYIIALPVLGEPIAQSLAVLLICTIRILAVRNNWSLPAM